MSVYVDPGQCLEQLNPARPGARIRLWRLRPWWERHDEAWLVSRLIYAATTALVMIAASAWIGTAVWRFTAPRMIAVGRMTDGIDTELRVFARRFWTGKLEGAETRGAIYYARIATHH